MRLLTDVELAPIKKRDELGICPQNADETFIDWGLAVEDRKWLLCHIAALTERAEKAEAECLEQARLNGMGSEREAALLTRATAAEALLKEAREALCAVQAKLAEYLERLLQGRTLPNRWVGEINDVVNAFLARTAPGEGK